MKLQDYNRFKENKQYRRKIQMQAMKLQTVQQWIMEPTETKSTKQ